MKPSNQSGFVSNRYPIKVAQSNPWATRSGNQPCGGRSAPSRRCQPNRILRRRRLLLALPHVQRREESQDIPHSAYQSSINHCTKPTGSRTSHYLPPQHPAFIPKPTDTTAKVNDSNLCSGSGSEVAVAGVRIEVKLADCWLPREAICERRLRVRRGCQTKAGCECSSRRIDGWMRRIVWG